MAYNCKNDIEVAKKLLTAVAYRMHGLINDTLVRCELGSKEDHQDAKFKHVCNYENIRKNCLKLSDLHAMIHNFTVDDNSGFNKGISEEMFLKQLQELCEYCGIEDVGDYRHLF